MISRRAISSFFRGLNFTSLFTLELIQIARSLDQRVYKDRAITELLEQFWCSTYNRFYSLVLSSIALQAVLKQGQGLQDNTRQTFWGTAAWGS